MPQYKLTYFNMMARGEPIRFLLTYGGLEFEDIRVEFNDWPKMKKTTPFGQLPLLEIDGKIFSQTLPICHYLAKSLNLIGKTDLDALHIDSVVAGLQDLITQVSAIYWETDPVLKAKKKEDIINSVVLFYLDKLEEIAKNNGGYFCGGELSYADIFFGAFYDALRNLCDINIAENRPNLQAIRERVVKLPGIKEWIEKRPKNEL